MRLEAIEIYARRLEQGEPINAYELELNSNHFTSLDRLQREAETVLEQKKQACRAAEQNGRRRHARSKNHGSPARNQQARHRLESDRQEQNALDELVSANFARRMSHTK